jgi:hypothetical protein
MLGTSSLYDSYFNKSGRECGERGRMLGEKKLKYILLN